jgi:uncharacterized protein DUF4255
VSNAASIAAVTAALRNLLVAGFAGDAELADTVFSTLPPDKARDGATNQVNLFLYETAYNAAWRNRDMPPIRPGETGRPPLPLDLRYLLTAYGRDDGGVLGDRVLGHAMSIFHDHPSLTGAEVRAALADSDLDEQPEHVRIVPHPITLDEMSKLWAAFQGRYRTSVAYQASVVLISSLRPNRTPLPVLTRGPRDTGPVAVAGVVPPFPTLVSLQPATAQLGDAITVTGHDLDGVQPKLRFRTRRLTDPLDVDAVGTRSEATAAIPDDAAARAQWVAGWYAVALVIERDGQVRETNGLPLAIVPQIDTPLPLEVHAVGGNATIELQAHAAVPPRQPVSLLLDDREVPVQPRTLTTDPLRFVVVSPELDHPYLIRLRIDGVDSVIVDESVTPPQFLDRRVVVR